MSEEEDDKALYKAMFNSSIEAIITLDLEGSILTVNPAAQTLFGYKKKELLHSKIDLLIPQFIKETSHTQWKQYAEKPKSWRLEPIRKFLGRNKKGAALSLELKIMPAPVDKRDVIIAFILNNSLLEKNQGALEVSEDRIADTQNRSKVGDWYWNVQTNKVIWSDMMFSLMGLTPSEKEPSYELALHHVHEDDRETYVKSLTEALTNKTSYFLENRITKKDGKVINVVSRGNCELDSEGNLLFMTGTVQDITELKNTKRRLKKAEHKNEAILSALPDVIFIVNKEGIYLEVLVSDPKSLIHFKNELVGKSIAKVLPKKISKGVFDTMALVAKKGQPQTFAYSVKSNALFKRFEMRIVAKGNDFLIVRRDITDLYLANEALKKEKETTQKYLDTTASILLVINTKGEVVLINQKGCEILGYDEHEIIGKNWFDHFIPPNEKQKLLLIFKKSIQAKQEVFPLVENLILTKDKSLRLIEWRNSVLKDQSGKSEATLSSGIDITDKRALEIERTQSLITGQENERRRLARELHDGLGQSISAIGLNLNALEPELKRFNERFAHLYEQVKARLTETMEEVRTISHNLTPQILEEYGIATALEHLCETLNQSTDTTIRLLSNGVFDDFNDTSAIGLYRVIQEAMNNALRHGNPTEINVHLSRHESEITVMIEDNGEGFDVENTPLGLGMSNMQARVDLLNGSIHFDSNTKSGTTVSINIPL